MKRETCSVVYVLGPLFAACPAVADVPLPTRAQFRQSVQMQDMHWVATLSSEEVDEVRSALDSGYYPLVEAALTNVVLHRLDDLLPILEHRVSTPESATAWPFCKIRAESLKFSGDPFEQLRQVLATDLPGDKFIPNCDKMDYCRPVRYMVTSLIVIEESRAVRAGRKKEPDLHGLELSQFEKELVKFNGIETSAAIDSILRELSKRRTTVTPREYILIQVLHTYGPEAYLPAVLDKLEQIVGTDGYAIKLLLGSLRLRCDKLDNAGKARLRSIIAAIRDGDPSPSLENTLSALETQLP